MASARIMSWNVRLTLDATDATMIGTIIDSENPDVVCMQESRNASNRLGVVLDFLRGGWSSRAPGTGPIYVYHTNSYADGTGNTGNTIVSRIQLSGGTELFLGPSAVGSRERRMIQRALASLPGGQSFFIYNAHLSLIPVTQRVEARKFAELSLIPQSRRIVCGDFNATPNDAAIGTTNPPYPPPAPEPGWVQNSTSRWLDFDHPANGATFPANAPGTVKIDYIFRLQATMGVGSTNIRDNKASDHRAVVAVINGI